MPQLLLYQIKILEQLQAKLLEQLKSGFKRTIKWIERQIQYLEYLIVLSFQGVNRDFVLSLKDTAHLTNYK